MKNPFISTINNLRGFHDSRFMKPFLLDSTLDGINGNGSMEEWLVKFLEKTPWAFQVDDLLRARGRRSADGL